MRFGTEPIEWDGIQQMVLGKIVWPAGAPTGD